MPQFHGHCPNNLVSLSSSVQNLTGHLTEECREYYDEYHNMGYTVYPKKYAHGFVVLCFVVVMQPFIMNSHEVFIHIHQGCFAGTGAIVRLPQCQWSKPDGYGKNQSMYNHNKAQQSKNRVHISWDILYIFQKQQTCTIHNFTKTDEDYVLFNIYLVTSVRYDIYMVLSDNYLTFAVTCKWYQYDSFLRIDVAALITTTYFVNNSNALGKTFKHKSLHYCK